MEFTRADQVGREIRQEMSGIFVDGFFQWLKYFSKNKSKLQKALVHIFQLDTFYIAQENGRVLSMAACPSKGKRAVSLKKREFTKHLGFIRGRIAYFILRKEFELKQYPLEVPDKMGQIEFVATAESSRGKGVAHKLLENIIISTDYEQYILEVASNNAKAINLYTRLGFKEVKRIPQKNPKQAGFDFLLYLQLNERRTLEL